MPTERADRREALVAEGLMRVADVARFLGLSRASVYQLMAGGDLPWVKLGRARRVPRRAVVDLAARLVQGVELTGRDAPGESGGQDYEE